MIHSIYAKNFYSFAEEAEVCFVVNDNAPSNDGYFTSLSGTRLSKAEVVIGPNSSGKTNILKILPFFKWLIVNSFNLNPQDPILVQPFMFGDNKNQPTELSVVFEMNAKIYTYSFKLNQSRILSEELKLTSKATEKTTTKKIFSREWDEQNNRYSFEGKGFDLPKGFENVLRSNTSVVGTAARLNHKESQEISKLWSSIKTNVFEGGWVGDRIIPNPPEILNAINFYSNNDNLKKEAEKLLSRFDLGLEGFDIEKKEDQNGYLFNVKASHMYRGQKEFLPLQYESSGTRQLFVILKTILQVLNLGGVAILDEIDVNLHPEIVLSLLNLFTQPETNPKDAQILFSTHSHVILSKLDKYQVILVEKNKDGASESWRLDEMSGVRADDNYYTKYMAGAYGAIPQI